MIYDIDYIVPGSGIIRIDGKSINTENIIDFYPESYKSDAVKEWSELITYYWTEKGMYQEHGLMVVDGDWDNVELSEEHSMNYYRVMTQIYSLLSYNIGDAYLYNTNSYIAVRYRSGSDVLKEHFHITDLGEEEEWGSGAEIVMEEIWRIISKYKSGQKGFVVTPFKVNFSGRSGYDKFDEYINTQKYNFPIPCSVQDSDTTNYRECVCDILRCLFRQYFNKLSIGGSAFSAAYMDLITRMIQRANDTKNISIQS